ncbi:hypothetical protein BAR153v2_014120 [Bartonella sp. AR 15-3]|nr:hypothetical protein BAR153v2_014120 [Bartonella sp. AR 15-3]
MLVLTDPVQLLQILIRCPSITPMKQELYPLWSTF